MKKKNWIKLTVLFTLKISAVMCCIMFSGYLIEKAMDFSDLFGQNNVIPYAKTVSFLFLTLFMGLVASLIFMRLVMKPIDALLTAISSVIKGDYSVRVPPCGLKIFRQLCKCFNRMSEELQSVETARNDFVNDFSHEFKTPVTALHGFAELLRDEELTDEERAEYLNIIISESERLSELSKRVLLFSKVENMSLLPETTTYDLTEQIRLAVILLEVKWSEKNITVHFDNEEYYINGNKNMLEQVWINLLDNAVKFSPENSEITVDIRRSGSDILVTVADSGEGIPDEETEHIFEKFYQSDTSRPYGGNGIGLPLVKKIAELHGGSVTVRNGSEKGAVFTVALPCRDEDRTVPG